MYAAWRFFHFLCIGAAFCSSAADRVSLISSVPDLKAALTNEQCLNQGFKVRARVLYTPHLTPGIAHAAIADDNGNYALTLSDVRQDPLAVVFNDGDLVEFTGRCEYARRTNPQTGKHHANVYSATIVERGLPVQPRPIALAELHDPRIAYERLAVNGIIRDVFRDEIDSRYARIVLCSESVTEIIPVSYDERSFARIKAMIGDEATVIGYKTAPLQPEGVGRKLSLGFQSRFDLISRKAPADADPFLAPGINNLDGLLPAQVARLGRHTAEGLVLATWQGNKLILRTHDSRIVYAELVCSAVLRPGQQVILSGIPWFDLYNINLTHTICQETGKPVPADEKPVRVSARTIRTDIYGKTGYNPGFHGKPVTLSGVVQTGSAPGSAPSQFLLDDDGILVPVDTSALAPTGVAPPIGSRIACSGICIMDTGTYGSPSSVPQIRGFSLILRTTSDLQLISRPPWWTPVHLLYVIGALLLAIAAILVWNHSLRVLALRKGRELFRMQITKAETELRIDERTRLAAELHDYIAQNLTAISYQVAAADSACQQDTTATRTYLATALQMLHSSRTELKRCLWDLRSNALNETDFQQAISETVGPVAGTAVVSVRFPLPRAKISDKTVHAVLSICRELTANAVHHGKAKQIRIAGELEEEALRFLVHDNGCGFDTANRLGRANGHFGLDGIVDRIRRFNGTLRIESARGAGTRVYVSLSLRSHPKNTLT